MKNTKYLNFAAPIAIVHCALFSQVIFGQTINTFIDDKDQYKVTRTENYSDFTVPQNTERKYLNFVLRGGDGGNRHSGVDWLDTDYNEPGGEGATMKATFEIGNGENQIPKGAKIRIILGEGADSRSGYAMANAGGGGGSGIIIQNPDTEKWKILLVAGGGGGATGDGGVFHDSGSPGMITENGESVGDCPGGEKGYDGNHGWTNNSCPGSPGHGIRGFRDSGPRFDENSAPLPEDHCHMGFMAGGCGSVVTTAHSGGGGGGYSGGAQGSSGSGGGGGGSYYDSDMAVWHKGIRNGKTKDPQDGYAIYSLTDNIAGEFHSDQRFGGSFSLMDVNDQGVIVAVDEDDAVSLYTPRKGWKQIPNTGWTQWRPIKDVAIDPSNNIWAVSDVDQTGRGLTFYWDGKSWSNTLSESPYHHATKISVGSDGSVFGLTSGTWGMLQKREGISSTKPMGTHWVELPKDYSNNLNYHRIVTKDGNNIYGLRSGTLYHIDPTTNPITQTHLSSLSWNESDKFSIKISYNNDNLFIGSKNHSPAVMKNNNWETIDFGKAGYQKLYSAGSFSIDTPYSTAESYYYALNAQGEVLVNFEFANYLSKTSWFDTTSQERIDSGSPFDGINTVGWAQARKSAGNMCKAKKYVTGLFNGQQSGEKMGLWCLDINNLYWFDTTGQERANAGSGFDDINAVKWAHARRVAGNFCQQRGYTAGFFNGLQLDDKMGLWCVNEASWFDTTSEDRLNSGWSFDDINTVEWAYARRSATNICKNKGYRTGFYSGHYAHGKMGLFCLSKM